MTPVSLGYCSQQCTMHTLSLALFIHVFTGGCRVPDPAFRAHLRGTYILAGRAIITLSQSRRTETTGQVVTFRVRGGVSEGLFEEVS